MGKGPAQCGVLAHKSWVMRHIGVLSIGRAGVGLVAAILMCGLSAPWPRGQELARIHVATRISAVAPSVAELGIEVGPPGAAPQKSFLSLRGLPAAVTLSRGQSVGPGSWVVPLASLPGLK